MMLPPGFRTSPSLQENMRMRRSFIPVLLITALSLSGCGTTEVVQPAVNASIGQQLIDLKKAYEGGALTQSEYEKQREKLIGSVKR
jgi:hypothetical protein